MTEILLVLSITLNLILLYCILKLRNEIETKCRLNSKIHLNEYEKINTEVSKLSTNMDRYFGGMAGEMHLISNILNSSQKGKK